ncbi:hypothetical protein O181_000566 [Austropuccinia psidii MF-1]|uniref:Uncharacterized protein n=1 Tax=Austropuccinia psidii MF-1 TaxID=1389203 RepID=A0A9Q3B9B4_9BASI|nr:hypothetical protein [Austropuccinia psidii MF-1]
MPGYETADWDKLKGDMKRRWGTVSPERRYRVSSITELFTKPQQEGGIRNMTQYRKFMGEYEAIITYLKRYQYIQFDINHNQKILARISTSLKESIYKEMIKNRAMFKALDGEKKTRFEDESWDEASKQVKELTHKLKNPPQPEPQPRNEGKESIKDVLNKLKTLSEAVNPQKRNQNNNKDKRFPQNNQPCRPGNPLPPFSSSYQPHIQAQIAPRASLKIIVRTQGESYPFPNYWRVPMEGNESAKDIVSALAKAQAELNNKFMRKPVVKHSPEGEVNPTEEKSTLIAHVEYWSYWKPPTISSANDPFESHIGLRNTKKRMERKAQNQETKKRADNPGTYFEEEKRGRKSHYTYQISKFKYSKTRPT